MTKEKDPILLVHKMKDITKHSKTGKETVPIGKGVAHLEDSETETRLELNWSQNDPTIFKLKEKWRKN